jgi:hypothetical protein
MAAVSLIESVMKFAIAVFSAAHAPSSRRALLFAQAALAGGHQIVRLFFYQDGIYNASAVWSHPRMSWTCPNNGAPSSRSPTGRRGLHRRRPAPWRIE